MLVSSSRVHQCPLSSTVGAIWQYFELQRHPVARLHAGLGCEVYVTIIGWTLRFLEDTLEPKFTLKVWHMHHGQDNG